jgi:hypothetical protein
VARWGSAEGKAQRGLHSNRLKEARSLSTLWSSSSSNRLASDGMSDLASSAVSGHRLLSAAISNSSSSFSVSRLVVETSQTTAPTWHARVGHKRAAGTCALPSRQPWSCSG